MNAIATPRANGQVERVNRTITEAIMASVDDEASWDEVLPQVAWGINNSIHSVTRQVPADLMFAFSGGAVFGDHPVEAVTRRKRPNKSQERGRRKRGDLSLGGNEELPEESSPANQGDEQEAAEAGSTTDSQEITVQERRLQAKQRLDVQAQRMSDQYNKRRKPATEYRKGDLVLWRGAATYTTAQGVNSKLTRRYSGPYRIAKVKGNDRYVITAVKGLRGYRNRQFLVAADSLRRYRSTLPTEVQDQSTRGDSHRETMETEDLLDLLES